MKMKRFNYFHIIFFASLDFSFILILREVNNIFIIITYNQQPPYSVTREQHLLYFRCFKPPLTM